MALPAAPLGVAAFLTVLALLVILAQPGRRLNLLFGGLLLLRAGTTLAYGLLRAADNAADAMMWARLNLWYALLMPLIMVALMGDLFFPRRRGMRLAALGLTASATAALVAVHFLAPRLLISAVRPLARGTYGYTSMPLHEAFTGFLTVLEVAFVVLAFRAARSDRESALSRHQAALLGLAFAFGPARYGAFLLPYFLVAPATHFNPAFLARAIPAYVGLAVILALTPGLVRALEGRGWRLAAALVLLSAGLGFLDGLSVTVPVLLEVMPSIEMGATVSRAAFAGAAALALLRYGLAGTPPGSLRRVETLTRAGLALSVALLGAGVVLALLGLTTTGLVAAPLLGVAVLLLSPVPLAPVAARLSRRILLAPDDPLEEAARLRRERPAADLAATDPLLGRYALRDELGRGGTATVHLATDLLKGQTVVVKRFHAAAPRSALDEARALAAARHPRIVPLLDVDRVGDETFLVLAHAPGGSARDLLDREGPLPPARALALARDALEGLAALHEKGLIHGDVKPENLLLDAEGRAMLGDLGSARFFSVDVTTTGAVATASLSTAAPEVLRGERPTPASDLYALAATLHRLLAGRHYVALEDVDAFQARERILLDAPRLPDPRVPAHVEEVLRRALAKRPEERPASAREMAAALGGTSMLLVDEQRAADPHHVPGT